MDLPANPALWLDEYASGDQAVRLVDDETGECEATVSVNLTEYGIHPEKGCFYFKTWSENEGLLESLLERGLVEVVSTTPISVGAFGARAYLCRVVR